MINQKVLNLKNFQSYLKKNFKNNNRILVSISGGLDSTVLFYLITNLNFFKKKNIFFVIFDHQKRAEGKFEIQEFINFYKISSSNLFVKKITLKNNNSSFQEQSRLHRQKVIRLIAKQNNIFDIFLGHHLDDLNETFLIRKIQQSGLLGLSEIFSKKIDNLNVHRPLVVFTKKQIHQFAVKNKIIWFEDRTNLELDYSRNKVRNFLKDKSVTNHLNKDRKLYSDTEILKKIHFNYFIEIQSKKFEINHKAFTNLNECLKYFVIRSFYQSQRLPNNKSPRKDNILNIIKIIDGYKVNTSEKSIFCGKITSLDKKICLNLN